MPLVEVKVFEDELTPEQTKELIQRITEAVTTVTSKKLREVTWVIVNEVKSGNWGVGGNALGRAEDRFAFWTTQAYARFPTHRSTLYGVG